MRVFVPSVSLTQLSQARVSQVLREGDAAVDATCGNGHDTLFLATAVGASGRVWGFDIQLDALETTRKRLQQAAFEDRVTLVLQSHAEMDQVITGVGGRLIRAVMFNLGYLPGGNKQLTTQTASTLRAIKCAWNLLTAGGLLSIVMYPGHLEGAAEAQAILQGITALTPTPASIDHAVPEKSLAPQALYCVKSKCFEDGQVTEVFAGAGSRTASQSDYGRGL